MSDPARIELGKRRWSWLLEFCGLGADDLALLAGALADAGLGEAVADRFVELTGRYPELRELIERTTTVEAFKRRLAAHVESLFAGRFDDARVDALSRVGVVHDRIGLPLTSFLGATLQLDQVVVPALAVRYGGDQELLVRAILAYRKLVTCDVAIIVDAFLDARDLTTDEAVSRLDP